MYSVESWVAQKARSWSSDRNLGTGFLVLAIHFPLLSSHISDGNHANQSSANCKGDKQFAPYTCLTQRVISLLPTRMPYVAPEDKSFMKKHVFCFFWRYGVTSPILPSVVVIPLKACAMF